MLPGQSDAFWPKTAVSTIPERASQYIYIDLENLERRSFPTVTALNGQYILPAEWYKAYPAGRWRNRLLLISSCRKLSQTSRIQNTSTLVSHIMSKIKRLVSMSMSRNCVDNITLDYEVGHCCTRLSVKKHIVTHNAQVPLRIWDKSNHQ